MARLDVRTRFGAAAEGAGLQGVHHHRWPAADRGESRGAARAHRVRPAARLARAARPRGCRRQRRRAEQFEALLDEYSSVGMLVPAVVVSVAEKTARVFVKSRGLRAGRLGRAFAGRRREEAPAPKDGRRSRGRRATWSTSSRTARAPRRSRRCRKRRARSSRWIRTTAHRRAGRRLRLLRQQVQPRHPGAAPAGLGLQAVPVFRGARERLHARLGAARCAHRARRRRPGDLVAAGESTAGSSAAPLACVKRSTARAISCRSACCGPWARTRPSTTSPASASRRRELPNNLTLALGTVQATPLQLATGYATFANGGYRVQPFYIDRIENAAGEVVYRAAPRIVCEDMRKRRVAARLHGHGRRHAAPERRLIRCAADEARCPPSRSPSASSAPQNAWLMTDMMTDVIRRGTGVRALRLGRSDLAGKTGTTNDAKDTWFNGFTQNLVAHGVGRLRPGALARRGRGRREDGAADLDAVHARGAARACRRQRRPMPDGLVTLRISPDTGMLASGENPDAILETFMTDHLPAGDEPGGESGRQRRTAGCERRRADLLTLTRRTMRESR